MAPRHKLVGIIGSGLLGSEPYSPRTWSGISRFFFKTCEKYEILERVYGFDVPPIPKAALMLKNFSFDRSKWKIKFYLDVGYYRALTQEIAKRLGPDDYEYGIIQIGAIYNIPSIVTNRTDCYSYHDGNLAQMLKSPYMPKTLSAKLTERALGFEKEVYDGMTEIFAMSEYLRQSFIEDFGMHPSKVANIGAGINLERIPEEQEKDYERQEVLFLGIDFPRKGGQQLLEAFRIVKERFPASKLHIVGPKTLKIEENLSRGIEFHGYISKEAPEGKSRFESIMNKCSLFVLPSLYEPFGIAPLEAMAYQIPCILTNKWAFPEMVTPGFNGDLVPCADVEALAETICRLLKDPEKLCKMGKAGRDFVLKNYTWDIVIQRLMKEIGF